MGAMDVIQNNSIIDLQSQSSMNMVSF